MAGTARDAIATTASIGAFNMGTSELSPAARIWISRSGEISRTRSRNERIDRGEYRLVRRQPRPNEGLVDWLLACPQKGFFVPIESESTDTL